MNKAIIFDSSTLISFAMNGILDILRDLKKVFNGSFLITQDVKKEVVDIPMTITRFKLEALKIQHLLDKGVLELVSDEGISKKTKEIMNIANSSFEGKGKNIKLVSSGEVSCLALSEILSEKKILNVVAIDERTTRMLVENPKNLGSFLEKKMHTKIISKKNNFEIFKKFKIIRSAELVYIAYKKKLVRMGRQRANPLTTSSKRGQSNGELLDALLWAVKFKGCSISNEEIKEIKKLG